MGDKRSTVTEQKRFLMGVSTAYQAIVVSAEKGHYEHAFFGPVDTDIGFQTETNCRRLRAAVQYYNLQFASAMRQYGHKYSIPATRDAVGTNSPSDLPEPPLDDDLLELLTFQALKGGEVMSRKDAVKWVKDLLVKTRGRELPGNFNPLLMNQIFWEQSEPWEGMAMAHIDRIDNLCSQFVQTAVESVMEEDMAGRLLDLKIDEALAVRRKAAIQELKSLIDDK